MHVNTCASISCPGPQAAVQFVRDSRIKLCALGADGDVLQREFGLTLDVSPLEASTQGLVAELERRGGAKGARVLAPVPLVTGAIQWAAAAGGRAGGFAYVESNKARDCTYHCEGPLRAASGGAARAQRDPSRC